MRPSRVIASVATVAVLVSFAAVSLPSAPTQKHLVDRADTSTSLDAISKLQMRLDSGTLTLEHDSILGYLPALLHALKIPASSQGLVFSRTSLQTDLITPYTPRALYFNDDVYVGYVHDSDFLEIAAVSPKAGVAFYTFDQEARALPAFKHETNTCLMCHKSRDLDYRPGFLMLSTITDRLGYPITQVHVGSTVDATPVNERFGGWYVTGSVAQSKHSGNVYSPRDFSQVDKNTYRDQIDLTVESALMDLKGKFDSVPYLTRTSDIVALMVLVHQTEEHNLMSAVHEAARVALLEQFVLDKYVSDSVKRIPIAQSNLRLKLAIEKLVRSMLYTGEAPLNGPMHGTSSFVEDFERIGPRDKQGRSLRDFDLQHRLFKYPMSFLVYSDGFNDIPQAARDGIYTRIHEIVSGADTSPAYARLTAADRKAVNEILIATKPDYARVAATLEPQRALRQQ